MSSTLSTNTNPFFIENLRQINERQKRINDINKEVKRSLLEDYPNTSPHFREITAANLKTTLMRQAFPQEDPSNKLRQHANRAHDNYIALYPAIMNLTQMAIIFLAIGGFLFEIGLCLSSDFTTGSQLGLSGLIFIAISVLLFIILLIVAYFQGSVKLSNIVFGQYMIFFFIIAFLESVLFGLLCIGVIFIPIHTYIQLILQLVGITITPSQQTLGPFDYVWDH